LAALVGLCVAAPVRAGAPDTGPAHLAADLKPGFAPLDETGATFDSYTAVNGRVIFLATLEGDVKPQCSLWTTDGTAAGTSWLAGLCDDVEPNDYTPQAGIWVTTGSMAFFTDYFGRFWRTDGTAEGTFRLGGGALKRGFSGVHRPLLGPDGRTIFFEGCTEAYGCEPWRSDGTPEGTVLLGDLQRGRESSDPSGFSLDGRRVLFATYGAVWATDGSPRGTVQVFQTSERADWLHVRGPEIFFGIGISAWAFDKRDRKVHVILSKYSLGDHIGVSLAEAGGRLLLVPFDLEAFPGLSLWETGGTKASTHRVGPRFTGGLEEFAGVGSRVVFAATTGEGVADLDLFFLDPGMRVAERFTRCPGGCPTVVSGVSGFAPFKGRLLFAGRDPLHGTELWSTDGTPQGTRLLKDLCPGACDGIPVSLRVLGDRLLFRDARQQLWVTDGTEAGTTLLALLTSLPTNEPWRFSVDAATLDGRIVFTGFDPQGGLQPWVSDLTPEGTAPLVQIGSNLAAGFASQFPTAVGARIVFSLYDGTEARLWTSDGTAAGTKPLLAADGSPNLRCSVCRDLPPRGGPLFFFQSGARLFATDGTPEGTRPILDLGAGKLLISTGFLGDRRLLAIAEPSPGTDPAELWTSDGTAPGTQKLLTLPSGGFPEVFMALGSQTLFFFRGLWRTDGTVAGTLPIQDELDFTSFTPGPFFHGKVFFPARSQPGTIDFWQSDGTAAGTALLGQEAALPPPFSPSDAVVFRDALYFIDWYAQVLWRSDGTAAGTRPFELPLNANGDPLRISRPPVLLGDQLFFAANDGVRGWELWKTDGTVTGTVLVRDIAPGPAFSRPESLTVAGGRLYFTATDGKHGLELWTSDGTAEGTTMVQDILHGPASSWPRNLVAADGKLFFTANDGEHGRELWVLPLEP
jgi:ELWxxDGT repeat protein